jgi:hypothetical protein
MDGGYRTAIDAIFAILGDGGGSPAGLCVGNAVCIFRAVACLFVVRRVICLCGQAFPQLSTERSTVSGDGSGRSPLLASPDRRRWLLE